MDCPSCHNNVSVSERNFGALFTCPQCQAVYFVNFEGHPEYSTEENPASEFPAESSTSSEPEPDLETFNSTAEFLPSTSIFGGIAQEITSFGNNEVQFSALHYSVEIQGLDAKDIVQVFTEAITDQRLGWNTSEVLKTLKNGKITLVNLNPVQAFMIYKKIQFLDLELKWKQYALE